MPDEIVLVTFQRTGPGPNGAYGPLYNRGDTAGFTARAAAALVREGVATYTNGPPASLPAMVVGEIATLGVGVPIVFPCGCPPFQTSSMAWIPCPCGEYALRSNGWSMNATEMKRQRLHTVTPRADGSLHVVETPTPRPANLTIAARARRILLREEP